VLWYNAVIVFSYEFDRAGNTEVKPILWKRRKSGPGCSSALLLGSPPPNFTTDRSTLLPVGNLWQRNADLQQLTVQITEWSTVLNDQLESSWTTALWNGQYSGTRF